MYHREWLFRNQKNYLFFWILLVIFIIMIITFLTCYSYYPYYQTTGIYRKEEQNVTILLESTRICNSEILEIKVEGTLIDINNMIISDYLVINNKIYNQVSIFFNQDLDKQILNISIKLPKTTLWQQIWKGMIK